MTNTILIVEDEASLLEMLSTALHGKGYEPLGAEDGLQAVETYKRLSQKIDLVLLNTGLPKLGGAEVFRMLKEINPGVKVIFLSGYFDNELKSHLLREGAIHFIQKPYNTNEVLERIREALDAGNQ